MDLPSIAEQAERPSVSTGHLPEAETALPLVSDAHRRFKSNTDGQNSQNSQVYPALASKAPSSARAGPQFRDFGELKSKKT
jgi:glutaminase